MPSSRVLKAMLGVPAKQVKVLSEASMYGADGRVLGVVVELRPTAKFQHRCPHCDQRCPRYDAGQVRHWRALDWGRVMVHIRAQAPRVSCPQHGVVVAAVPWAHHRARHTHAFEQLAAWYAVHMSASAAAKLLRCSWRSIGAMTARVLAALEADGGDALDGLRRIGIDEISYKRGHKYLVVVVDHDRRRLVWAAEGRSTTTVMQFFNQLGRKRSKALTHISADGARWISDAVDARAPKAVLCLDPFHVVSWATEALDKVRRAIWRAARAGEPLRDNGRRAVAGAASTKLKGARYALLKNPGRLTDQQRDILTWIATDHADLYRAYQLKEDLRLVFQLPGEAGMAALDLWLAKAADAGIAAFTTLAKRIRNYRREIEATLTHGLSNALTESLNTRIRLIIRRGCGFHHVDAIIGLAKLTVGLHRPVLPT